MIQGIEELAMESHVDEQIDLDYEFEAPQYFDFSVPETDSEAQKAEEWFLSARSDPPSPFIIKLNMDIDLELTSVSESCEDGDVTVYTRSMSGATMSYCPSTISDGISEIEIVSPGIPKAKANSQLKSTFSRCSTLMKPTASHLAKLNQPQPLRRLPNMSTKTDEKTSQNYSSSDSLATKRQKLESGYLHKVSELKNQILQLRKVSKKAGLINIVSVRSKPKLTVPKEPELVTARRAQIRRSKTNADSLQHTTSNANIIKALPLDRKVLQSSLSLPKKITADLSESQGVNVANSISSHNGTTESRRQNMVDASKQEKCGRPNHVRSRSFNMDDASKQEKCERANHVRSRSFNIKALKSPSGKKPEHKPPVEFSNKLYPASKVHQNSRSPTPTKIQAPKENTMSSMQRAREVINVLKGKSERFGGKLLSCGTRNRMHEMQAQASSKRFYQVAT